MAFGGCQVGNGGILGSTWTPRTSGFVRGYAKRLHERVQADADSANGELQHRRRHGIALQVEVNSRA